MAEKEKVPKENDSTEHLVTVHTACSVRLKGRQGVHDLETSAQQTPVIEGYRHDRVNSPYNTPTIR